MIPMPTDTLDIALECLKQHPSWFLFPIKRLEKTPPCFNDNLRLASNDPEQIRKWYKLYPGCNWGVLWKLARCKNVHVMSSSSCIYEPVFRVVIISVFLPLAYFLRVRRFIRKFRRPNTLGMIDAIPCGYLCGGESHCLTQ